MIGSLLVSALLAAGPVAPVAAPRQPPAPTAGSTDLDSYLAYLARGGAIDRPYYQEVSPGLYQLIPGRAGAGRAPEMFSRAQLLEKFGFDH